MQAILASQLLFGLAFGLDGAAPPPTPGVLSQPKGFDVVWTPEQDAAAPEQLTVVAVSRDWEPGAKLPAKRLLDDGTTEAAECELWPEPGECVYCPEDGKYTLDVERIASMQGAAIANAATKDGVVGIAGLAPGKRYMVFMQYAPTGLHVSQCTVAFTL